MSSKFTIIGAGISGLMLGCILKKNSIDCSIYERSSQISEYDTGITISPNGYQLLEHVNILENLRDVSCRPLNVVYRNVNGSTIKSIPLNLFGKVITMNRKELIRLLHDQYLSMNGSIFFNHEVIDIDIEQKKIIFKDLDKHSYENIAACDGINSNVREKGCNIKKPPYYSGYSAWRGIGNSDSKNINIYLGTDSHVVCYPINDKLETSFTGIFKTNISSEESWKREGSHNELSKDLSSYDTFLHSLFTSSNKVFRWSLYQRDKLASFKTKDITLLGDAAHPMLPFLAQGASMALEDAFIFGNLANHFNNDYEKIQSNYDLLRLKRAHTIQSSSEKQAIYNHVSNPLLLKIRNFVLKNTNIAMRRTENIYNYNALNELNKIL